MKLSVFTIVLLGALCFLGWGSVDAADPENADGTLSFTENSTIPGNTTDEARSDNETSTTLTDTSKATYVNTFAYATAVASLVTAFASS